MQSSLGSQGEKKTFEELTSVLTYEGRFKIRMKCKKAIGAEIGSKCLIIFVFGEIYTQKAVG